MSLPRKNTTWQELQLGASATLERVCSEQDLLLFAHASGNRNPLNLPEVGTAHQRKVWKVIRAIPRGEVLTYGQVAKLIRSAPRAVGQACGANWFPVAIPCHRVTATGGIGGFGGYALHDGGFHHEVKRWLLHHEQVPGY